MSGEITEVFVKEEINVEETSVNLDCVKTEPNEEVLNFDENIPVKQYRITLESVYLPGGTAHFKFEEDDDNLVGFLNSDVIMENVIVKSENIKDEFSNNFYCSKCNGNYKGYCLKCSTLLRILNSSTSLPNSISKLNHMPTDILEIRETLMGKAVFLLRTLPKDVIFGPFEGISGIKSRDGCKWKISDKKLLNIDNGNWIKDIACAASALFKNLDIFQIDYNLYYQTNREIIEGEELLIYYADEEIQVLENSKEYVYTPHKQGQLPTVFACALCCLGFASDECLMEHKRKCPWLEQSIKDFELIECPYCKTWLGKLEHEEYHVASCLEKHLRIRSKYSEAVHRGGTRVGDMKHHLTTESDETEYQCDVCLKIYSWRDALQVPTGVENAKGITEDDQCFSQIKQESSLNREHVRNTVECKYKCLDCFYRANSKKKLKFQDTKPFQCGICSTKFTKKMTLKTHLKNKHTENGNVKDYKCPKCNYRTNSKHYLIVHANMHNGIKPFQCDICTKQFSYNTNLKAHIKNKHSASVEKDYKCTQCSYQTNGKRNFRNHLNMHNDVKLFECDVCKKKFIRKDNLKKHIKDLHTKSTIEKKYKCPELQCSYQTNYTSALNQHANTHKGIKPYQCNICMKKYTQKKSVENHMKDKHTESGEKDYKCKECPYQTNDKGSLKGHIRMHSGIKPYQCDICMQKFSQNYHLKVHIKRKHAKNSEKEYKCSECSYQTHDRSNLKVHLRIHNGIKPYECDFCMMKFTTKQWLNKHVNRIHA